MRDAATFHSGRCANASGSKSASNSRLSRDQQVAVEGRGDAGRVIIGGEKRGILLHQVHAQQKAVAGLEPSAHPLQQFRCFVRLKVADAGADIEHQLALAAASSIKMEAVPVAVGVVHHARGHGDSGNLALDPLAGAVERAGGDVHRFVEHRSLPLDGGLEQEARLLGRARAQLRDAQTRATCRLRDDRSSVFGEDSALGAREVVLGQFGDRLEESGAGLVVKQPGRAGAWAGMRGPGAPPRRRVHRFVGLLQGKLLRSCTFRWMRLKRDYDASRMPENCHRVSGEKKLR